MTIELKDMPVNIKRVVLEFDDSGDVSNVLSEDNSKNIKVSAPAKKIVPKSKDLDENNKLFEDQPLDLNFGSSVPSANKENIEKPNIEDKKRDVKISSNMQNLKI